MVSRILCLGNDLLADDAFGLLVAQHLQQLRVPEVEVVAEPAAGFCLLDALLDCSRLVVVDTVASGADRPGSVRVRREEDLRCAPGSSPHYVGLFEALALARALGLATPQQPAIVTVEGADCFTVGGTMHPAVREAVPKVAELVLQLLAAAPAEDVAAKTTAEAPEPARWLETSASGCEKKVPG